MFGMLVLALDTTSEKGGAAIYRDGKCLALAANEGPANVYSITLFGLVARALEEAGIKPIQTGREGGAALSGLGEVELFAVANGPGSFTGIRVGTAAVQAWARAFGRPARGVSILEALVCAARPDTEWAVPLLDARRGEFFLGCFRRAPRPRSAGDKPRTWDSPADGYGVQPAGRDDAYEPEGEGWVLRPNDLSIFLREQLPAGAGVTCLVREHDGAARSLRQLLPESYRWQNLPGTLLEAIARLGLRAYGKGMAQDPADLHACYIRRPDAELNWRE